MVILYQPRKIEGISLTTEQGLKHMYILGATGSGKTKMIENHIRQNILNGQGFCLIDPHGDLYESILRFMADQLMINDYFLQRYGDEISAKVKSKIYLNGSMFFSLNGEKAKALQYVYHAIRINPFYLRNLYYMCFAITKKTGVIRNFLQ